MGYQNITSVLLKWLPAKQTFTPRIDSKYIIPVRNIYIFTHAPSIYAGIVGQNINAAKLLMGVLHNLEGTFCPLETSHSTNFK